MAFKKKPIHKERIELVSLVDMAMILLVFFLVTSFVIRMPFQEKGLYVPTPKNELGRAQIVIQIIEDNQYFWMDETASEVVERVESRYGYLSPARLQERMLDALIEENIIDLPSLNRKINHLHERAKENPVANYFIMIRCPNGIPYFHVVDIISQLTDNRNPNISYGCIGGTLEEIRECRQIRTVVERDAEGRRRKNIRIDF